MATVPEIEGYSDPIQVGRGGFGVVYRARQDRFNRVVALKVLNVEDVDSQARRRFERECKAMGSLGWHPNVVAVFDSGIDNHGRPWLAMEYLDAGSLGDRLRREGRLRWEDAIAAGVQVAGALGASHASGVLHRDLKPENLLIGPFGEIKLSDFGIAAIEGASRSTTGHASFTVDHVAPEVLRRRRPDERSDLYGLASTIYGLISGTAPFAGDPDDSIAAVITSVLQVPPPRLTNVPEGVADLLTRTLSKNPDERPQSAADFGRYLQTVQVNEGQVITELRLTRTTPAVTPAVVRSNTSQAPIESIVEPEPKTADSRPTITGSKTPRADPHRTISGSTTPIADPRPTRRSKQVEAEAKRGKGSQKGHRRKPAVSTGNVAKSSETKSRPGVVVDASTDPARVKRPSHRLLLVTTAVLALGIGAVLLGVSQRDTPASEARTDRDPTPSTTTQSVPTTSTVDPAALAEYAQAVEDARLLDEYLLAVKQQQDIIDYAAAVAQAASNESTTAATTDACMTCGPDALNDRLYCTYPDASGQVIGWTTGADCANRAVFPSDPCGSPDSDPIACGREPIPEGQMSQIELLLQAAVVTGEMGVDPNPLKKQNLLV